MRYPILTFSGFISKVRSLEFLTSVTHLVLAIPPHTVHLSYTFRVAYRLPQSPYSWSHAEPLDTRKEGKSTLLSFLKSFGQGNTVGQSFVRMNKDLWMEWDAGEENLVGDC
ncbi:hypothetical protein K439DRAFT_1167111 [Ramaria rubella]|nr:hypothetical protein K439DRAFT_1167111 [Ramaria rubella]